MNSDFIILDSSKTLGESIRRKRKSLGLTLDLAASLCGVSLKFLQALETGKPTAQLEKSLLVAKSLGIRIMLEK